MSVIIIEGCDKTGKTTLANKLSSQLGYEIVKCGQPIGDPYEEYVNKLLEHDKIIFDRFLYGELVYGPLYRKKSQLSDTQIYNLELLLRARDATLIHCKAEKSFIEKKFKSENEDFVQVKDIDKILSSYDNVIKQSRIKTITREIPTNDPIDISSCSIPDILFRTRYVGNINPIVLFIGERNNERAQGKYQHIGLPFDFGRSSTILRRLISDANITSFGMTNIIKNHLSIEIQVDLLEEEINSINPIIVVALGRRTYDVLNNMKMKIYREHALRYMWHPSYLGRNNSISYQKFLDDFINKCEPI